MARGDALRDFLWRDVSRASTEPSQQGSSGIFQDSRQCTSVPIVRGSDTKRTAVLPALHAERSAGAGRAT